MSRLIALVSLLCLQPITSRAMNFAILQPGDPSVVISAAGEIEIGDDRKLHEFVGSLPASSKVVGIVLNSAGGNLLEGVRLAVTVASSKISTGTATVCASACFLVFAAGTHKVVFDNARIGIHSASESDGSESDTSQATTTKMARLAAALNVPAPIVGKMVTTPPNQITWLSRTELQTIPGLEFANTQTASTDNYEPGSALQTGARPAAPVVSLPAQAVPLPNPSQTASAGNVPTEGIEQTPSYIAGRSARAAWETWFNNLAGDFRAGSQWWAEHRSTAAHDRLSCENQFGMPAAFLAGCMQARAMLSGPDQRRRADALFKAGWNSL